MTDATTYTHRYLSVDQQLALRTAAGRLGREFDGTYGTETIERFRHTSYDQFANRSTVPNFLPLLAERFARQRLQRDDDDPAQTDPAADQRPIAVVRIAG